MNNTDEPRILAGGLWVSLKKDRSVGIRSVKGTARSYAPRIRRDAFHCSSLTFRFKVLAARCSLLAARCSLLAARCSLLAARVMRQERPVAGESPPLFRWLSAHGFRRFGAFDASGLTMTNTLQEGSVYLFVLSGSILYAGETGRPLRGRMAQLRKWMRDDQGAVATRFRAASADRSEIWARPERMVPTLDGEAPDRFAVEWRVIRHWCPPLNKRGAARGTVSAPRQAAEPAG